MKWIVSLLSVLLISCSNTFVPQAAQVRDLELRLRSNLCIGDLGRWARNYWIDPERTNLLRFSFGMPTDKWTKGIRIIPTHRWKKLVFYNDAHWVAAGQYDLESGKVRVTFCGPNTPRS